MWRCALVLCLAIATKHCATSDSAEDGVRLVKTLQGTVRGHKDPDSGIFAFCSIPYATAPVGSLRFKAPLPGPAWLQPLDAVDKGIICPQPMNPFIARKLMQEDCLVTSVYVPDTEDKNLPVVVYVHGGAFQIGFGDMIPPISFVKNKKVIAVTFNYRLGPNGFLCLGTKDAPGNAGLKDQLALLRWVQRNIASFGGNPDDVTIVGGSAGSVSVDLLMLSKTTNGLFSKIIPESGAGVGIIALQVDPIEIAKNYASNAGFTNVDDIYALEQFYKDASIDTLTKNFAFNQNSTFGFTPCVERNTGDEVFLHDAPINILKSGKYKKLPMLLGFDNMEGIFQIPNFDGWKDKMNENFFDFLPADLEFESDDEKEKVGELVKKFYFGDKPIDEKTILGYVDFFTDVQFGYAILLSAKLHAEAGNNQVYLYEYSFVDEDTPVVPYTNVRGATHCAQTIHILGGRKLLNPTDTKMSKEYKTMQDILQDMWYNFITTGKPVPDDSPLPKWPAVGTNGSPYMSLGVQVELRDSLMQDRIKLWDEIYSKYYRVPVAPPTPLPEPHFEL